MKKQKILFVINTLGRAGAESALLSLLSVLDPSQYDISLYVIMAQGEMRAELPIYVKLCNPQFEDESVLTKAGLPLALFLRVSKGPHGERTDTGETRISFRILMLSSPSMGGLIRFWSWRLNSFTESTLVCTDSSTTLQYEFLYRFHIERAGGAENFFRCRPLNETECVSKSEVCAALVDFQAIPNNGVILCLTENDAQSGLSQVSLWMLITAQN